MPTTEPQAPPLTPQPADRAAPAHAAPARSRRPSLVVVDDHALVLEGLRKLLEPRFDVLGVAHDGTALLRLLDRVAPDCVLLDLSMPGQNGLELIPQVRAARPSARILIVSMFVDRPLAEAALRAGAAGFVPKDAGIEELERAIREVAAGRRYVSARVPTRTQRTSLAAAHPGLARLTPRQQQIVHLIGVGRTTAEIATLLGCSRDTVGFHRKGARRALGIADEFGLLRFAILTQTEQEPAAPPADDPLP